MDLAVLTSTAEEPAWRLWEKIVDALGTERLDLVDLRRASPVLRFEIVRSGRPIYVSDEAAKERFILDTLHLCQRRSKTVQLWRYKTVHLQIRLLLDQTTSPNYRE